MINNIWNIKRKLLHELWIDFDKISSGVEKQNICREARRRVFQNTKKCEMNKKVK